MSAVTQLYRSRLAADISFGALGAALSACAFAFAAFGAPPLPPAPIVAIGVPSPLTDMTRSFVAIAGGEVWRSFLLHPLGPLCFTACVVAAANAVVVLRAGRRTNVVDRALRVPFAPWIVAIAFAMAWIRQIAIFG